ncbi:MerR family transcriptional regulator [Nonomuraea sp. RK-328]|nr:MerR family transcriptional regulator [Nonomuraea sp. RK-328]
MPESAAPGLTIGQVAERTGLSVHALRFYEREGILAHPVHREAGGRRVYAERDVEWLSVCVILRASGMPLPDIRAYTGLVRQGPGNEEQRLVLMRRHQERVREQMERLSESFDLISYKVRVYEDLVERAGDEHAC